MEKKITYITPYGNLTTGDIWTINGVQYIFKGKDGDKLSFELLNPQDKD